MALLSTALPSEQALRCGVIPDSFPSQLAVEPSNAVGQRRFIIMDDNVHALHGANFARVCVRSTTEAKTDSQRLD
jgi:hypothetical protein